MHRTLESCSMESDHSTDPLERNQDTQIIINLWTEYYPILAVANFLPYLGRGEERDINCNLKFLAAPCTIYFYSFIILLINNIYHIFDYSCCHGDTELFTLNNIRIYNI